MILEIILLSFLAAFSLIAAIGLITSVCGRRTRPQVFTKPESRWDCPPEQCKPIEPIKMKNGKDGMMWGGNNYTIKTNKMNQNNPFAKGVSINQDILTDEWHDLTKSPDWPERVKAAQDGFIDFLEERDLLALNSNDWMHKIVKDRVSGINARQLLALGREEE